MDELHNFPLVSVIICSFNQEEFISEAIQSVIDQDYPHIEIIVIDDASTDHSFQLIKDINKKNPGKLKIARTEVNAGVSDTRNLGLDMASGEYVCFLDGDDLYLQGKIRNQVNFMENHIDCAFSYHDGEVIHFNTRTPYYSTAKRFGSNNGSQSRLIRYGAYTTFISCMFRHDAIRGKKFHIQVNLGEDWVFLVDSLSGEYNKYYFLDEKLALYRTHKKNITKNWSKKIRSKLKALDIIESKYPEHKKVSNLRRAELLFTFVIYSLFRGDIRSCIKYFLHYIKFSFPYLWVGFRLLFREARFIMNHGIQYPYDPLIDSFFRRNNISNPP